ncbi:hypothetical protein DL96DRAFT_119937 [Flagelloscypha sp. PMI_526]|nr:hypothetical protein DL96DRAFT_119937 [Flagelloscypha sp. PMI_526]
MRFTTIASFVVMALPFVAAAPFGLLDNAKPGEPVTFRKFPKGQSCGFVGPCFCDVDACYQAVGPARNEPSNDDIKIEQTAIL